MITESNQLFELRKKERELLTFNSKAYGKISLLLLQYKRYREEPRIVLAIAQRIDNLRFNLNNIADQYLQIYESTQDQGIKAVANGLEKNVRITIQNIESSFT